MTSAAPEIPVSWGELIDKIAILEIKAARLTIESARTNVRRELALLQGRVTALSPPPEPLGALKTQLLAVNQALWDIEDRIRDKEAAGAFDADFVELARSVYRRNDERAAIKRQINLALSSALVEEKSYADWGGAKP